MQSEPILNNSKLYKSTTSFGHILGNTTAIIDDYIKSVFPKGYFKKTRITTEIPFKELRKNLIELEKPLLVIDPKFLTDEESDALPQINWDRFINIDPQNLPHFFQMNAEYFIKNEQHQFFLGYTVNRYKLAFRIIMLIETDMAKMSLINYLRSNFRFRHRYPIRRYTETLIPKGFIQHIANKLNMNIMSNDFLTELNRISDYTIVRLHRPATGHTEFYILSISTIQIYMPDLPNGERQMIGRVQRHSQIEFVIQTELNVMNNFILATQDSDIDDESPQIDEYMFRLSIESRTPAVEQFVDGRTLYTKIALEFDDPEYEVDLYKFLGSDTKSQVNYIIKNGLTTKYADIVIYRWNQLINPESVEIDDINLKVKFKNLQKETVYNVYIYFDLPYLASITKFINENTLNTTGDEY